MKHMITVKQFDLNWFDLFQEKHLSPTSPAIHFRLIVHSI